MWRKGLVKANSYSRNNKLRFGARRDIGYELPISTTVLLSVCEAESQLVQADLELLIILSLPPSTKITGTQYRIWHRAQSFRHRMFWLVVFFGFFSLKTVSNSVVQTGLGLREILLLQPRSVGLLQVICCLLSSRLN